MKNVYKHHQKITKMRVPRLALPSLPTTGLGSLHDLIVRFGLDAAVRAVLVLPASTRAPTRLPSSCRHLHGFRDSPPCGGGGGGGGGDGDGGASQQQRRRSAVPPSEVLHFLGFRATDGRRHPRWRRSTRWVPCTISAPPLCTSSRRSTAADATPRSSWGA